VSSASATGTRNGPANRESDAGEAGKLWTVLDLLRWTTSHFSERGCDSPRLDAECLLAHALGVERLALYTGFERPVNPEERAAFRDLVLRRARDRVPVAQLVGSKEFWSLPLRVTPDVLVPRPETETLVAVALGLLPALAPGSGPVAVLDIGTGSGAVALALASERPELHIAATDISIAALQVARENADMLGMAERVECLEGDLFEPVRGREFAMIVSNPPYLALEERAALAPELAHEPDQALFGGQEGGEVLAALAAGVPEHLTPGGAAAFEIAPDQAETVSGWCREAGLLDVTQHRDLAGHPRVVSGRKGD